MVRAVIHFNDASKRCALKVWICTLGLWRGEFNATAKDKLSQFDSIVLIKDNYVYNYIQGTNPSAVAVEGM